MDTSHGSHGALLARRQKPGTHAGLQAGPVPNPTLLSPTKLPPSILTPASENLFYRCQENWSKHQDPTHVTFGPDQSTANRERGTVWEASPESCLSFLQAVQPGKSFSLQ